MWFVRVLALLVLFSPTVYSQTSPYSGMEKREIKALSQEDIDGYLKGDGMGFALAAELNHYPGPKHVLELADKLSLDPAQEEQAKEIYDEMHAAAVDLGVELVALESALDKRFREKSIDSRVLQEQLEKISEVQGRLRYVHLNAHLRMRKILTQDQIHKYRQIRGYHPGGHH